MNRKTIQFDWFYKGHLICCYEAEVTYLAEEQDGGSYGEGFSIQFEQLTEIEIVSIKQIGYISYLHDKLFKISLDYINIDNYL